MSHPEPGGSPVTRKPRPDSSWLVAKFLGTSAGENGPFGLLGLHPAIVDEDSVLSALRSRLQQTAAHPEGVTPEADEVRLALHAAAAQLLDAGTRRAMLDRWAPDAAPATPAPSTGASPAPPVRAPASPPPRPIITPAPLPQADRDVILIQHEAVLAIAACGGWNERARAHLQMFAHARAIPPQTLIAAISHLDRPHAAPSLPLRPPIAAPTRVPVSSPHASSRLQLPTPTAPITPLKPEREGLPPILIWSLVIVGVLAVIILITVGVSIAYFNRKAAAPPPAPTAGAEPAPVRDTSAQAFPWRPDPKKPPPSIAAPATNSSQIWLQELTSSLDAIAQDPDAGFTAFTRSLEAGALRWTELAPADLTVAQRSIVDALYTADSPDRAVAILLAIAPPSDPAPSLATTPAHVIRSAWTAGMLNRISRERDLSTAVLDAVERSLTDRLSHDRAMGDPAFEAAAIASLRASAEAASRAGSDAVWDAWLKCAAAIGTLQPARRTDLLLIGLSQAGDAPAAVPNTAPQDPAVWTANARAIGLMVPMIAWHREPIAQRWLLTQFDAFDTSPRALVTIAREMATRSTVPGTDATMVLAEPLTEADRRSLRDRYARLFGLDTQEIRDAVDERWAAALASLDARPIPDNMIASFDTALAWSRLSEAAWLHWRGAPDRAIDVLASLETAFQPATPVTQRPGDALRRDEIPNWTHEYLAVGSEIPRRTSLLASFPSGDLHPVDAEVVLAEALRGSPIQVREAARAIVDRHSRSPAMVNAMLEAIPTAPRTISTAEIVTILSDLERVPMDTPDWRATARRALVERLLRILAGRGEYAAVDDLSELFAVSHAARAASPGADTPTEATATPAIEVSLAQERDLWRLAGENLARPRTYPDSLASIDADLAARMRIAEGSIQRAVAEEIAILRLMGVVVVCERPELAVDIRRVIDDAGTTVAAADHVIDQLLALEQAIARMWSIRLAPQEPPP